MDLLIVTLCVMAFIVVVIGLIYTMARIVFPNNEFEIVTPQLAQQRQQAWRQEFDKKTQAAKLLKQQQKQQQYEIQLMELHKKAQELEKYKQQHPEVFAQ